MEIPSSNSRTTIKNLIWVKSYTILSITVSLVLAASVVTIISIIAQSIDGSDNIDIALAQTQGNTSAHTTATNFNTSTNSIDTFKAKGQISSLVSDVLAGRPSSNASEIWVLGGNWQFDVSKGNLTNLQINILMTKINGKGAHQHAIESIRNSTGAVLPGLNKQIVLTRGNYTDFKGIVDIATNGKLKWKDVPIVINMLNGNVFNIHINPTKTDDHFKGLPVFGTVKSVTDQNGNELLNR